MSEKYKVSMTMLLVIWGIAGIIVFGCPFLVILALNTLYPQYPIEITLETYFATMLLTTVFGSLTIGRK